MVPLTGLQVGAGAAEEDDEGATLDEELDEDVGEAEGEDEDEDDGEGEDELTESLADDDAEEEVGGVGTAELDVGVGDVRALSWPIERCSISMHKRVAVGVLTGSTSVRFVERQTSSQTLGIGHPLCRLSMENSAVQWYKGDPDGVEVQVAGVDD